MSTTYTKVSCGRSSEALLSLHQALHLCACNWDVRGSLCIVLCDFETKLRPVWETALGVTRSLVHAWEPPNIKRLAFGFSPPSCGSSGDFRQEIHRGLLPIWWSPIPAPPSTFKVITTRTFVFVFGRE